MTPGTEQPQRSGQNRARDDEFFIAADHELRVARRRYSNINSLHEGYAVILEELDEVWQEIKRPSHECNLNAIYEELVQVAAMAARTAVDCTLIAEDDEALS